MSERARFEAQEIELPFKWLVYDDKYEEEFAIDLVNEDFDNRPHCTCKEFRFQIQLIEIEKRDRETCVHIDFLIEYLQMLGQRPKKLPPPKFHE